MSIENIFADFLNENKYSKGLKYSTMYMKHDVMWSVHIECKHKQYHFNLPLLKTNEVEAFISSLYDTFNSIIKHGY